MQNHKYLISEELENLPSILDKIFALMEDRDESYKELIANIDEPLKRIIGLIKESPYLDEVTSEEQCILEGVRAIHNVSIEHFDSMNGFIRKGDIDPRDEVASDKYVLSELGISSKDVVKRRLMWTAPMFSSKITERHKLILEQLRLSFLLGLEPSVIVLLYSILETTLVNKYLEELAVDKYKLNMLRNQDNQYRKKRDGKMLSEMMFAAKGLENRGFLSSRNLKTIDSIRLARNKYLHSGEFNMKSMNVMLFLVMTLWIVVSLHDGIKIEDED